MNRNVDPTIHALATLTAHGCPITGQRRLLLEAIGRQRASFTADDILRELRDTGTPVGRATVFRALELMTRLDILGRVGDGDHSAYTMCDHGHHYHLLCTNCGQVLHIEDCPVDPLLAELQTKTGFRVDYHRLEIAGLCSSCRGGG
jgi:Fur family transcriptional regulator, ferric uptake regulator